MKIEEIYQTKFLFINGNVEDKNKNILNFLEYFHDKRYFLEYKINLLISSREFSNGSKNIIEDTNFENQGVVRIINSTDKLFHALLRHAYAIVINSENEGLDLNLMKAIKLRKPIYINPNHTFFKNRYLDYNLNQLNIHKINSNCPKYNFEVSQFDEHIEKYFDLFTKRDEPHSVSIEDIFNEIMEIKS